MTKHLLIFCVAGCLALAGCVSTGEDSAGSGASGVPAAGSESEVVPYIPPLPGAKGS